MKLNFSYNTVFFIQSLPQNEPATGEKLHKLLNQTNRVRNECIPTYFFDVENKRSFLDILSEISKKIKRFYTSENRIVKPIIQFDCHGNNSCFSLADGSTIPFEELAGFFGEINLESGMNLTIIGASCFGSYVSSCILECIECKGKNSKTRAPFNMSLGFDKTVQPCNLQQMLAEFYLITREENMTLPQIIGQINSMPEAKESQLKPVFSKDIFYSAINYYKKTLCTGRELEERIDRMIREIYRNNGGRQIDEVSIRKELRKKIEDPKTIVEWHNENAPYFFGIDKFPKNRDQLENPLQIIKDPLFLSKK